MPASMTIRNTETADFRRRLKWSEIEEDTDIDLILGAPRPLVVHRGQVESKKDAEEFFECREVPSPRLSAANIALAAKVDVDEEYLDALDSGSSTGVDSASTPFEAQSPLASTTFPEEESIVLSPQVSVTASPEPSEADPSPTLASVGAEFHFDNQCIPCKFLVSRSGCKDGENCIYCHAPHPELNQGQRRRLMSRINRRKRQEGAFAQLQQSGLSGDQTQEQIFPQEVSNNAWNPGNNGSYYHSTDRNFHGNDFRNQQQVGQYFPHLMAFQPSMQVNQPSDHQLQPGHSQGMAKIADSRDADKDFQKPKRTPLRLQNKPIQGYGISQYESYDRSSYRAY